MHSKILLKFIPHIVALIAFLMLSCIYFYPQLQGKQIFQGDINLFKGMSQELKEYKEATGEDALWTNSMFGGMPSYQIYSPQNNNVFKHIEKILQFGFDRPIGYFIYGAICFYILMIVLGINPWLSIIAAIAFSFTTNNLVLFEAGHASKVRAIMCSPLIIAGFLMVVKKKYWLGGFLFCLGMGLNLYANHYQMSYYLALVLLVFIVVELVKLVRIKDYSHILKSGLILLGGLLIAVGTASGRLLPTIEYSSETMRGEPVLETQGAITSSSQTKGLEWQYAMAWSNGFIDLMATYIPGVAGGSSAEPVSNESAFARFIQRSGAQYSGPLTAPLYWGPLPFTSGPIYFGCIFMFLFLFGIFFKRGTLKWCFLGAVVLTYLLSMGKHLEFINRIVFEHLPAYSKFRTPQSILSITVILIPLFGGLALQELINTKNKASALRAFWVSSSISLGLCLIFALAGPMLFDFIADSDPRLQSRGFDISVLKQDRISLLRSDSWRTFLLVALVSALIYGYIKGKITNGILLTGLGLLCLFDVMGIGRRYINHKSFVSESSVDQNLQPRPVDQQILRDTDPYYRVHDQTIDSYENSMASYHHRTIGGMHAAKLQRYSDMIEYHLSQGNMWVFNMLNTKYFILPGADGQPISRLNYAALGNAWFINELHIVETANEEIESLSEFDPAGEAFVHREYADYIQELNPEKNGGIRLTEYKPNNLKYTYNTEGEQFAVFSEIWYGPDKGWQAYLDGIPVDHIRVNYVLRGMRVPGGTHSIEFKFEPESFKKGQNLSRISSGIFGAFAIWIIFLQITGGSKLWSREEKPIEASPKPVKKLRKPVKRKKKRR